MDVHIYYIWLKNDDKVTVENVQLQLQPAALAAPGQYHEANRGTAAAAGNMQQQQQQYQYQQQGHYASPQPQYQYLGWQRQQQQQQQQYAAVRDNCGSISSNKSPQDGDSSACANYQKYVFSEFF